MRVVRKFALERIPEKVPNTRQALLSGLELKNKKQKSLINKLLQDMGGAQANATLLKLFNYRHKQYKISYF
jgi:hypothetical protein